MLRSVVSALLLAGLLVVLASNAQAVVVNFDDLNTKGFIPNSYNGLTWNNMYQVDGLAYNGGVKNGYTAGTVSKRHVALNAYGSPATIGSSSDFVLNSLYLTAAWNDDLIVSIKAFHDGTLNHAVTVILSAISPKRFTLNWKDVDSIVLTSSGGTLHKGYDGEGEHFVLDNLAFNEPISPVPTPASLPLLAMGLAGLLAVGHRSLKAKRECAEA